MADFTIKRNDRLPELLATCLLANGAPADLTGAISVEFHMKTAGGGAAKVDAAGVLVTPAEGTVKYVWTGTDTDTSGSYLAEFEVMFSGTRTETFPNTGNITIDVVDDLA